MGRACARDKECNYKSLAIEIANMGSSTSKLRLVIRMMLERNEKTVVVVGYQGRKDTRLWTSASSQFRVA